MVAACDCHDPVVFGHGWACELRAGPAASGGAQPSWFADSTMHAQEYDPVIPPESREPDRVYPSERAISARNAWLRKIGVLRD